MQIYYVLENKASSIKIIAPFRKQVLALPEPSTRVVVPDMVLTFALDNVMFDKNL